MQGMNHALLRCWTGRLPSGSVRRNELPGREGPRHVLTRFIRRPPVTRLSLAAGLLAVACSRPAPSAGVSREAPREAEAPPPAAATPAFADKVWKVGPSSGGEPGAFYVFLSDGTLLIASSHGTPSLGRWHAAGDTVTLVEEGIAHPAAVLRQSPDELAIRFAGRGEPLEITFVRGVAP